MMLAAFLSLGLFGCASGIYKKENVKQLSPQNYLEELATTEDAYLLDIRTPMEYRKGHFPGAVNINFLSFSFGKKISELDTGKPVFIYCHTAHRSPYVAKKLNKKGFFRIVDLAGGYRALKRYQEEQATD